MAFWGVEIKPGTPYNHLFDKSRGRLHISQATLGTGASSKKSLVQCIVGYNSPVLLCSLLPDKTESCSLDFEFEEDDVVTFSVIGPRSVHLAGYYLDKVANFDEDVDESDSYGEDVGESDSEESTDYDMDDEYDDDFIDDIDDDFEMLPSSRPKSGVVIEEILDDEKSADGDNRKQITVNGGTSSFDSESEDEDGLPKSSLSKTDNESAEARKKSEKKVSKGKKKKAEDGGDRVTGTKRKSEDVQEGKTERGTENQNDSAVESLEAGQENLEKPKKKKKKERTKEGKSGGDRDDRINDDQKEDTAQTEEGNTNDIKKVPLGREADGKASNKSLKSHGNGVSDEDTTGKKKKKKKQKKNKNKIPDSDKTATAEEANKGSVVEIEDKKEELKATHARSYPNGLVVEEIKMGKPDGKKASPGKTVYVHYIGKLKKNDKIFDSNVGRVPFKFRLGVGQVIKGWDVGVNGMRIGDKRRLTIPPSMGYGSQGSPPAIPPNAWLLFDVELVNVR